MSPSQLDPQYLKLTIRYDTIDTTLWYDNHTIMIEELAPETYGVGKSSDQSNLIGESRGLSQLFLLFRSLQMHLIRRTHFGIFAI